MCSRCNYFLNASFLIKTKLPESLKRFYSCVRIQLFLFRYSADNAALSITISASIVNTFIAWNYKKKVSQTEQYLTLSGIRPADPFLIHQLEKLYRKAKRSKVFLWDFRGRLICIPTSDQNIPTISP